jgi:50S ribosomal protein L16 3-hydroxylase
MRGYWQKRPLLVRQAFPRFDGIIGRDAFLELAMRPHATSRLVIQHPGRRRGRWERHDGPFGGLDAGMLPERNWTLLVNSVESLVPGGWEILNAFSFIPAARVDDLMVSYAADGGSVGPHDDLYDVFLLQGPGRRRWQISTGGDRAADPDAAIKVLKSFVPEEEWLLEPGDMLYLPPGVAHLGIAEGPCFTYSIGFLAPTHAELVENFLGYVGAARAAATDPTRRYQDPDLRVPLRAHDLGAGMIDRVAAVVSDLRWDKADVADFLGRFLTRPKPSMVFRAPRRPLPMDAFARRLIGRRGRLTLALPTRGLIHMGCLFVNGDARPIGRASMPFFRLLFEQRAVALPLARDTIANERTLGLLYELYAGGGLALR